MLSAEKSFLLPVPWCPVMSFGEVQFWYLSSSTLYQKLAEVPSCILWFRGIVVHRFFAEG